VEIDEMSTTTKRRLSVTDELRRELLKERQRNEWLQRQLDVARKRNEQLEYEARLRWAADTAKDRTDHKLARDRSWGH
jgi:hypothetical protein